MLAGGRRGDGSPLTAPAAMLTFGAMSRTIDIEALCAEKGLRITEQRKVIARVLGDSEDHPDVETLHARASAIDHNISIATVYRTVRLFEEAGILERHEFGDGRSRYEAVSDNHHDHLIDVETGKVIEFADEELETLQKRIAEKLGYRLVDHRMELYGVASDRDH
jgi:Fur family ferric uptake transcriptional regulator